MSVVLGKEEGEKEGRFPVFWVHGLGCRYRYPRCEDIYRCCFEMYTLIFGTRYSFFPPGNPRGIDDTPLR